MKDYIADHTELIKKEVDCRMRPFLVTLFEGQEEDKKRQEKIIHLLKKIEGNQWLTWRLLLHEAAIIILFFLILNL